MTIRLDSTKISVVVKCTLCPFWSAFADTKDEGWGIGAAHEERAHPELEQARHARDEHRSKARRAIPVRLDTPTTRR